MCIQILTTEIIPKHKYSSYTETNIIEQARRNPDCTLFRVDFLYRGNIGMNHILIESGILREPPEYIHSRIKKITLQWARENIGSAELDGTDRQKYIVH